MRLLRSDREGAEDAREDHAERAEDGREAEVAGGRGLGTEARRPRQGPGGEGGLDWVECIHTAASHFLTGFAVRVPRSLCQPEGSKSARPLRASSVPPRTPRDPPAVASMPLLR